MRILFTILLLLEFTSNSIIKKRILSYPIIISKADLIIEGEISNSTFSDYEYNFQIVEFIKGNSEKTITIDLWKEWTCDKRIEKPQKGQKLLLFPLKRKNGEYHVTNGSRWDLFIRQNNSVETFTNSEFPEIDELKEGSKLFLNSFKYIK